MKHKIAFKVAFIAWVVFVLFAVSAFFSAAYGQTPITVRGGIVPVHNLRVEDTTYLGQVIGIWEIDAGDTMPGYLPMYMLPDTTLLVGGDTALTTGNIGAYAPATDLGYTASTRVLTSSTGTDVTLPLSSASAPGLLPTLGTSLQLARVNSASTSLEYFTPSYLSTVTGTARFSGSGTSGSPLELAQQSAATGQGLGWNGSYWAPWTFYHTASSRFSGAGTSASPLELAQQGATSGQVLTWNGTSWAPAAATGGVTGTGSAGASGVQRVAFWKTATSIDDNSGMLFDTANVRLGLGVTPTERLDITGNFNFPTSSSTAGNIKQGGQTIFHTYNSTSNRYNYFLGYDAGNYTLTPAADYGNVGIGKGVMKNITTGFGNVGIGGFQNLQAVTTGSGNVALGSFSLYKNTTGGFNFAMGYFSLSENTTGDRNVGIGTQALSQSTIGGYNTAIGDIAMSNGTPGGFNTGVGGASLRQATTGAQYNTGIGFQAAHGLTTGAFNTGVGGNTLAAITTGGNNTAIGYGAALSNVAGSNNIYIGYLAGAFQTSGSNRLIIGAQNFGNAATELTNSIIVGTTAATPASQVLTFNAKVGIGVASPTDQFEVSGNAAVTGVVKFSDGSASAPSGTFANDTNTGVYRPIADTWAVSTAGAERIRIGSTGNVGIGVTGALAKLHISNVPASTYAIFATSDNAGRVMQLTTSDYTTYGGPGSVMVMEMGAGTGDTYSSLQAYIAGKTTYGVLAMNAAGGNVAIGSTTAAEKLTVAGNLQWSGALKPAGSAGTVGQVLASNGGGANYWTSAGTIGGTAASGRIAYGDGSNSLTSSANFTYGSSRLEAASSSGASLRASYSLGVTYTDFGTNSSGYGYLNPTGKRLGINTTAPSATIHAQNDGTSTQKAVILDHSSSTMSTGEELQIDLSLSGTAMARVSAVKESTGYGLKFFTGGAAAVNSTPVISATGSNNITIGDAAAATIGITGNDISVGAAADDITIGNTGAGASTNFQGGIGLDDYVEETSNSGTLQAKAWNYIDPTGAATRTLPSGMNDGAWVFVVNLDPSFDITISAPGGETLAGSATITATKTGFFAKNGTVWVRIEI